MSKKETKWVLIDLTLLGTTTETPLVFGNLKRLIEHGVVLEDKLMNYDQLRWRLNKNKEQKFWKNHRYIIKECEILKSKMKS